ncbi:MAG TPA: TonB-dependent receptor [Croceibacterium sp.]|jgi:hypothetical protein
MHRMRALVFWLVLAASAPLAAQTVHADNRDIDDDRPKAVPAQDSDHADADVRHSDGENGKDGDEDDQEHAAPVTAIVVSARRLDIARTGVDAGLGATTYELHNETIENRPGGETGSVGSILAQAPGVTLSSSGPQVRGSNAVQVRINGVIVPEAIADPADRLSSRLAESTRLITGTLPAQFGFTPGGVIAVTSKNGLYQHGGQAELFAGTRGAFEPAFEWGGSADSSSLFASGSLESGNARVADIVGPSAREVRHEIGGLAFVDHIIDDENRVSLISGGSRERRKIGPTDLPAGVDQTGNVFAVGTMQHSTGPLTLQASLFAARAGDSARFATDDRERRTSLGTQVDSSLGIGDNNTIRAGLLLTRSTSREDHAGSVRRTSLGAYLQDEWKPDPRLTVNLGLRGDWLRRVGDSPEAEPRGSVVWQSGSGFSAHAGYARYASAPPLGEERPGLSLPDETDDYFDAGVQQKIGAVTVGLDGYYRRARGLIEAHATPGSALPQAFAFSRGRFHGVEASLTYARGPLSVWANVSVSKSQGRTLIGGAGLLSPAGLVAANRRWVALAQNRPLTGSGGVGWRSGKLNLSADVVAGSGAVRTLDPSAPNGARAPAYANLGVAAVYHMDLLDRPLDLRLDLTDLTDVHYLTSDAANLEGGWTRRAVGRSLLVGFEQSF